MYFFSLKFEGSTPKIVKFTSYITIQLLNEYCNKKEGEDLSVSMHGEDTYLGVVNITSIYIDIPMQQIKLKYSYIHPDGVEQPNLHLVFNRLDQPFVPLRPNASNMYQLCKVAAREPEDGSHATKQLTLESFEHLNLKPKLHPIHSRLNYPKATSVYPVQLRKDYREDIHERLKESLAWLHKNGLYPQLEGR